MKVVRNDADIMLLQYKRTLLAKSVQLLPVTTQESSSQRQKSKVQLVAVELEQYIPILRILADVLS